VRPRLRSVLLLIAALLVAGGLAPAAAQARAVITSGPPPVSGPDVVFSFQDDKDDDDEDDDDDDEARRFVCRLNFVATQACFSPTVIRGLADGVYVFQVRSSRRTRWASWTWTVNRAMAPAPAPSVPPAPDAPADTAEQPAAPPAPGEPGRVDSTGPPPPAPPAPAAPGEPEAGAPAGPGLMTPFPTVRLAGLIYPGSVRVRVLSVRAPVGARISVRCRGRACPLRSVVRRVRPRGSRTSATVTFRQLTARRLPSGTRLEVRVTMPGHIGKYTSFRLRGGTSPRRSDRCLVPGRWAPAPCPA